MTQRTITSSQDGIVWTKVVMQNVDEMNDNRFKQEGEISLLDALYMDFFYFLLYSSFHAGYFESNIGLKNALKLCSNAVDRAEVRSVIEFHIQRNVNIGRHFNIGNDNDNDNKSDKVTFICWIFRISKM